MYVESRLEWSVYVVIVMVSGDGLLFSTRNHSSSRGTLKYLNTGPLVYIALRVSVAQDHCPRKVVKTIRVIGDSSRRRVTVRWYDDLWRLRCLWHGC